MPRSPSHVRRQSGPDASGPHSYRVYAELCVAVEEMVALIHADGREMPPPLSQKGFSGKFVSRVDPAIHRRLAAKALAAGESLK